MKKFKKEKRLKYLLIALFMCIMGGGILAYSKSFANFNTHKEFNIIQGKIPNKNNGDILLAVKVDDKKQDEFPEKGDYIVWSDCTNDMSVDWDYDNWHAKINSNITKPFVCTLNFKSYDKFINTITYNEEVVSSYPEKGNLNVKVDCNNIDGSWDYNNWKPVLTGANKDTTCDIKFEDRKFNIGDYISYSSKSNNYKISKDLTGYSADQTINPSELNLWRVIRINDDSTVDIVSEYTSSNEIICTGKAGYENIVLTLNTIAKQYETPGITVGSRHMGYNGQPDVQSIDIFYYEQRHLTDVNLVKNAIGTLTANKANGTTPFEFYWIAERFGNYIESVNANCYYVLYYRSTAGVVASGDSLYSVYISNGQNRVTSPGRAIRPIVTLKADINTISGIGSKDNPYKIG